MPKRPVHAPKKTSFMDGRIGSGMWGGRKIVLAKHEGLRPTKDRVRMAVFNLLQTRVAVEGAVVFDLCCGSGAYGLEALSRGAARVVCVDTDVTLVSENAALLKADVEIFQRDVRAWLPDGLADIVILDPPYESGLVQAVWARRADLAAPGSWWVVEVGGREDVVLDGMEDVVVRTYGESRIVCGRMV